LIIFDKTEKLPSNGMGLGYLNDVLSAKVTEERNGVYFLEFKSLNDERLKVGNVVQTSTSYNKQFFRINEVAQNSNNTVEVSANHISYDMGKIVILPKRVEGTPSEIIADFLHNSVNGRDTPFMISTTHKNYNIIDVKTPINARLLLMGSEGSILDVFGGEFTFNNFLIIHHLDRGVDRDVCFYYGSNISEINTETLNDDEYTGVVPYAIINEQLNMIPTKFIGDKKMLKVVDLSDKFSDNNPYDVNKLMGYAREELTNLIVKNNITIKFAEFKSMRLDVIHLCDTITIKYKNPDVELKAKVVKVIFDVLREKIIEIEIGYLKNIKLKKMIGGGQNTRS